MRARPYHAMILNFLLPGAGLLYLRKPRLAMLNFFGVQLVLVLLWALGEPVLREHVHYVFLGLAAASGGYAHGIARTEVLLSGTTESHQEMAT